ncbi:glycoside hydrolase family 30 protein [Fundicoccus sp. Sow4_F4]|uniref:glycoside hydrolase family 30 protein n=1 Tax=Fundicoccus sp. Sow4_F4 TaxID=3438783 RepID=UPI003F92FB25
MIKTLYRSYDKDHMFVKANFTEPGKLAKNIIEIEVDPLQKFQTIDGFGASFTDSAAYLMDKVLSQKDREDVMTRLFASEDGIGLSIIRNPMGASDYARFIYSYHDLVEGEKDTNLTEFSIDHDRESILPLTKWAQQLNPSLKVFASPWSAPGWMKTSGSMIGGKLLKEYYSAYADYFVKFVEAYDEEGVMINAVTPQNEPLYVPVHYPGMELLANESAEFISKYLKPALMNAGLSTKVFGYDHNWDRVDYPLELLDKAADSVDGIAWHWYGGNVINQSRVANFYPDKEIHFTEGSGGEWIPEFEPAFSNLMRTTIDILRNGSQSVTLWNLALDENNGPTVPGFGKSTCRGLLKINQSTQTYDYTLDYYGLAHYSKHVRPGARRIFSSESKGIKSVAFENKDQSIVVVLFNNTEEVRSVSLSNFREGVVEMLPKSAATIKLE